MKIINEAEYKDFFSKDTLQTLQKKSADNIKVMLSRGLGSALSESNRLINELKKLEKPHIAELELLSEVIIKDLYGIVNDNKIEIQANIVDRVNLEYEDTEDVGNSDGEQIDIDSTFPDEVQIDIDSTFPDEVKRRIVNSITQGGAVRGAFSFYLFKEYLDDINPSLVEKYNSLLKSVFGIYDDDNAIAMLLSAVAQKSSAAGGLSEGYYDEETEMFVIKAQGIVFPILLHELIKGVYEIVATEGFTSDAEKNKKIIKNVDKIGNEPEDLRYGKYIYDAINNLVSLVGTKDNRIREYFISEIYKLPDVEFLSFIENLINERLTSDQRKWISRTLVDIEYDLKKDDTGLSGLDYTPEEDDDEEPVYEGDQNRSELNPRHQAQINRRNTITRVKPSGKIYKRDKNKKQIKGYEK
jgi:hypothetical protein